MHHTYLGHSSTIHIQKKKYVKPETWSQETEALKATKENIYIANKVTLVVPNIPNVPSAQYA